LESLELRIGDAEDLLRLGELVLELDLGCCREIAAALETMTEGCVVRGETGVFDLRECELLF
jgi:hypothetical protein